MQLAQAHYLHEWAPRFWPQYSDAFPLVGVHPHLQTTWCDMNGPLTGYERLSMFLCRCQKSGSVWLSLQHSRRRWSDHAGCGPRWGMGGWGENTVDFHQTWGPQQNCLSDRRCHQIQWLLFLKKYFLFHQIQSSCSYVEIKFAYLSKRHLIHS